MKRSVIFKTFGFAGIVVTCGVLAACYNDAVMHARAAASAEQRPTDYRQAIDPCVVVTTPHQGTHRLDARILRLQAALRRDNSSVALLERLGWAFVAKARSSFDPGFYQLAEQCAHCMDKHEANRPEALLLRGHVRHHQHRFREAETLAWQLVAQRGGAFDYGLLGDVLMEQGKLVQAAQAYQRMMDQKPGPQAYSRTAHMRWLSGDLQHAIDVMRMAAASFRDGEAAAWTHVRLALYEWQAGQWAQASQRVTAVLETQPDYAPALLLQGRLLLAQDKFDQAVPLLRRALRLSPLPAYQWALSEALRAAADPDGAAEIEAQLMQLGAIQDRRTFALYLATTKRDLPMALALAKAEHQERADVLTLDTLAWALYGLGRFDQAYRVSQRALAVGTQDARLFYHASAIAMAVGKVDEAQSYVTAAARIQHLLFPSERQDLSRVSAALPTQTAAP